MATRLRRWRAVRVGLVAGLCSSLLLPAAVVVAQRALYLDVADVRALVADLGSAAPSDLPALSGPRAEARWLDWIGERDDAIRRRLAEGDEDTLVNWALLGTSFTSQPPVRLDGVEGSDERAVDRAIQTILLRIDDLMRALAAPEGDERRLFARRFFERQGLNAGTPPASGPARDALVRAIQRVMRGLGDLTRQGDTRAQSAAGRGAPTTEFQTRGLSLDTSLAPNFAVHESLAALKARGLLAVSSVRRVAIIGAGLDFADKNTGFDFYPVQTLQPFAVLDSLRRLALAPASGDLAVVALDISPRVIDHVTRTRAAAGGDYVLRLPLPQTRLWLPQFRAYWVALGETIGTAVAAPVPAALKGQADLRTIRVWPSALEALSAEDVNIVVERGGGQPFDVVIATNVLLYYDPFDQAMALANIGKSLRPGGVLLTNTALPRVPSSGMQRVGSRITLYTQDNSGDEIIWYQRLATSRPPARP